MPLVKRTRATLRKAEFGFLGVVVYTRVHTPRRCGHASSAGTLLRAGSPLRGLRTSWLVVGMARSGTSSVTKRPSHHPLPLGGVCPGRSYCCRPSVGCCV